MAFSSKRTTVSSLGITGKGYREDAHDGPDESYPSVSVSVSLPPGFDRDLGRVPLVKTTTDSK